MPGDSFLLLISGLGPTWASQMNLSGALGEWKSRTLELGGLPEWWFSSEPGTSLGV